MGKPYAHQYLDAATSRHGPMLCGGCGQPITEGEYRCYERSRGGDWRFVTHHRACCADDAGWSRKDANAAASEALLVAIETDVRALLGRYPGHAWLIAEEVSTQAEGAA